MKALLLNGAPDASHGADGERPDQRVGVVAVHDEGVDDEQRGPRLDLGIVHQVEVDELLQLHVLRGGGGAISMLGLQGHWTRGTVTSR